MLRVLITGFALVLLLLGAAGAIAIRGTREIEDDTARAGTEQVMMAGLLGEMQSGQNTLAAAMHELVRKPDSVDRSVVLRDLETAQEDMRRVVRAGGSTPEASRWKDLEGLETAFAGRIRTAIGQSANFPDPLLSELLVEHDNIVSLGRELLEASATRAAATDQQIEKVTRALAGESSALLGTSAGKTSTVVFSQYWKGATHSLQPSLSEAAYLVHGNVVEYQRFDQIMMDRTIESIHKDGLPDLLTLYFIGADGVGHKGGTAAQAAYLEKVFDLQIGRLIEALGQQDSTWKEHTQFIFTSDHGRTDTKASAQDAALEITIKNALERAGYSDDQYRIVENGGVVHLYFRSKVIGARWSEQPLSADIEAVAKTLENAVSLKGIVELIAARRSGVGYGYTLNDIHRKDANDISVMLAGLESAQSGDVLLLLKRGRYFGNTEAAGAQHGSIFADDLAIPLIIAQGGASAGRSPAPISTTDIAGIIAAYLGFSLPRN